MAFGDSSKKGWSTVKDGSGTPLLKYRDQIKQAPASKTGKSLSQSNFHSLCKERKEEKRET